MCAPSVHHKIFLGLVEQGANRRGLFFSVDWHPLRAFLENRLATRSHNIRLVLALVFVLLLVLVLVLVLVPVPVPVLVLVIVCLCPRLV